MVILLPGFHGDHRNYWWAGKFFFPLIRSPVYKVFHVSIFNLPGIAHEYATAKDYYYCNRRRRLGSSSGFLGLVGMPYFYLWIPFARAGHIQRIEKVPRRALTPSRGWGV